MGKQGVLISVDRAGVEHDVIISGYQLPVCFGGSCAMNESRVLIYPHADDTRRHSVSEKLASRFISLLNNSQRIREDYVLNLLGPTIQPYLYDKLAG